ncbi:MAG: hypothetical protein KY468_08270 [Armatimonadetes bacterium]|nr:hypothetical protein [Armatimonadota bacterium]
MASISLTHEQWEQIREDLPTDFTNLGQRIDAALANASSNEDTLTLDGLGRDEHDYLTSALASRQITGGPVGATQRSEVADATKGVNPSA